MTILEHTPPDQPIVVLTTGGIRDGAQRPAALLAARAVETITARTPEDAVALIHRVAGATAPSRAPEPAHANADPDRPFDSGWALAVSYDLGRAIEPAAGDPRRPPPDRHLPLAVAVRLDRAEALILEPRSSRAARQGEPSPHHDQLRNAYTANVRAVLDYIRSGDVYQVNLTERFTHPSPVDRAPIGHRALAAELFAAARPAHGCLIEWPNPVGDAPHPLDALISASPELFLSYDPSTRTVRTKPMKGTRPAATDPAELDLAEKDRAELAMIVDLMRNDLTRICRIPSVRVETPRAIDTHADSVHQATATVAGELAPGRTLADAILATFPPGSVTGAPKIRAMQIIDELETTPRGFYCGLAGWIDDSGRAELSVTIRAAVASGPPHARTLDYHAGAGIVADSDPDAEWIETMLKTEVLRAALAATTQTQTPTHHRSPHHANA